ncbi:MAG: hypothetical protein IPM25_15920 [Chloracidobacterium sp.]|nr:hypothetical protein [Chloracidobacterium sp.]
MITRANMPTKMMLLSVAVLVAIFAIAQPAFAQCDKLSDAEIVANIYEKINKDGSLKSQVSHINVVGVADLATVKFQGWTNSKSDYDKVLNIALSLKCLKVNVNQFESAPPAENSQQRVEGGCAPGTKACGDVCIPEGDPCNIGGRMSIFNTCRFDQYTSLVFLAPAAAADEGWGVPNPLR